MTESYNTTCMQRQFIDRGTTVPASLRVFTSDAISKAQFKSTFAWARPDLTFNGSFLMEGRQMNDARLTIRAQAPDAVQFLFDFSSVFCVGGDLSTSLSALSLRAAATKHSAAAVEDLPSLRVVAKFTAASTERLLFVSPRSTMLPVWMPCILFSVPGSLCDAGWSILSSSAAITVTADWIRARSSFAFSRAASAKSERFRAVSTFRSVHPAMERALRL